ncbi:MAG: hypothetical protein Q8P41_13580 [Pseudomonadota bacterium]|nr:hypothetical protein [Pseudomonadota bacterium]
MLLRVLPVLWPLALLGACNPDEKDSSDAPPINQDEDSPVICDGTAPVITELSVGNYGELFDFEGTLAPALLVAATATDDDGDLHRMNMTLWWDDVVDGTVDTSAAGTEAGYYAMDEEPCGMFEATYGLVFEVDGNRFDYATEYEFAAEVVDDAGLVSAQVIASGTAPNMDGSDG